MKNGNSQGMRHLCGFASWLKPTAFQKYFITHDGHILLHNVIAGWRTLSAMLLRPHWTTLCDCNWIWNMDLLGIMEDSVNVGVQMVDTTPGRDFPDSRKPVVSEVKPQSKCWKFSRNGLQERPVLPTRVMWGAWCLPGKPEDHKTLNLMERGSLRVSILIYLLGVFMGNWKMVSRNLICIFSNVCLIEIGQDFLVSKQMHFCSLII